MSEVLGIYGGTFDPVHLAHLRLAEEARESLGLARVRWIPAGQPNLRQPPQASPQQRLEMVHLAIADHAQFELDDSEVCTASTSYTVETLQRLRKKLGKDQPLVWLMGADAFLQLNRWHRWQKLFQLAHLGVAARPGSDLASSPMSSELAHEFQQRRTDRRAELANQPAGLIQFFALTPLAISSSQIRAALAAGHSARYLLAAPVVDYISRHQLYANV